MRRSKNGLLFEGCCATNKGSYKNLLMAIAFPEPDLKYFSNSLAFVPVSTAMYARRFTGQ
jgi:hypothetical protein